MASEYPGDIDAFPRPTSSDSMLDAGHTALHNTIADAIEAIEAVIGIAPSGSEATVADRIAAVEGDLAGKADTGALADVAFSGDYDDLINRPSTGDTGWRKITLSSPAAGFLYLRRVGAVVFLVNAGSRASVSTAATYSLPPGFRSAAAVGTLPATGDAGGTTVVALSVDTSTVAWTRANVIDTSLSWPTDDDWPTTLPGTAA